jgi:hypothetical protein
MDDTIFWLLVISYSAHILEEYNLNWKKWVFTIAKRNVEWSDFIITNSVVIILGICLSMIGSKHLEISLMFPALMMINAIFFHILPTIKYKVFSPGLITSILLFLPLSFLTYFQAYSLIHFKTIVISIIGGFIIMIYPILLQYYKRIIK